MRFLLWTGVVLPTLALAATSANPRHILPKRQSGCDTGEKVCGDYCIESSYTCCPDQQGGCPATEECQKGDNGEYGCCDKGETCTGDGGVQSSYYFPSSMDFSSLTYTDTYTDDYTTTSSHHYNTATATAGSGVTITTGSSSGSTGNSNGGGAVTVTRSTGGGDAVVVNGLAAAVMGLAAML